MSALLPVLALLIVVAFIYATCWAGRWATGGLDDVATEFMAGIAIWFVLAMFVGCVVGVWQGLIYLTAAGLPAESLQ